MLQTPIETDAVRSVGEPRAGFVSGFLGMTYQLGAALGIAAATVSVQRWARRGSRRALSRASPHRLQRAGLTQGRSRASSARQVLAELPVLSSPRPIAWPAR